MKARHVFAALVGGGVAAALGYLAGVQVGFGGGVRASARVFGCKPNRLAKEIKRMSASRKERNPRMGD